MNQRKSLLLGLSLLAIAGLASFRLIKYDNHPVANAGLTIPDGFNAVAIADNLGSARHMVVTPNNDIYVHLEGLKNGKGIVVLHDNGSKADVKTSFGNFPGTGIRINNG
ncbi:MAG: sorbosone dehydrogenase, partial [Mucilaginibacter sp.]|nr:sorbosone dehydrogenase [Mucilaginibacter sp.]